jgi:hypothetical protein
MIEASVRLDQPKFRNQWINESPINEWLLANVGRCSKFRDSVTEEHPWHVDHRFGYLVYSFARERDAVMFALRWS